VCGTYLDHFAVRVRFEKDKVLMMTFDSGLYYIIRYGDEMRAWIDVGFSTVEK
jgi:hypothetical protein